MTYKRRLSHFSTTAAALIGSPEALIIAVALSVLWFAGGITYFGLMNDAYEFAANTPLSWAALFVTIIVLIDTRRESRATQIKLDELIRSHAEARNELMGLERREEDEMEALERLGK